MSYRKLYPMRCVILKLFLTMQAFFLQHSIIDDLFSETNVIILFHAEMVRNKEYPPFIKVIKSTDNKITMKVMMYIWNYK